MEKTYGGHTKSRDDGGRVAVMCLQAKYLQELSVTTQTWERGMWMDSTSGSAERNNPADTLILHFWIPKLRGNTLLLLYTTNFLAVCYSNPRIEYNNPI